MRAFEKWRRTPDSLHLAEPFLATDDFQDNNYDKYKTKCLVSRLLTWVSRRLQLMPASSVVSGHSTCGPKNNLHIPSSFRPKKCLTVRGPSGLNSHIRRGRRWHGNIRRINITCIMLTRFMSLSRSSRIRLYSTGTSPAGPQFRPMSVQVASCDGGPERNSDAATHFVPLGAVT